MPRSALIRKSLAEQIYETLRSNLMDGEFRPGERLTIASLAEQFGTSITPVREAISRLASEQILEVKAATSVIVPNLTTRDLREIVLIRKDLEGLAARRFAEIGTTEMIAELEELNEAFIQAASRDPKEAARKNRDFHFRILRFAELPYVEAICENMWVLMGPFLRVFHEEIPVRRLTAGNHQHFNFLSAVKAGDLDAAQTAMRTDIGWSDELISRTEDRRNRLANGEDTA